MAKRTVTTYKGFKIQERSDFDTGNPIWTVYTAEEWSYSKGYRSPEWDAVTMEEAKQFIDSYKEV